MLHECGAGYRSIATKFAGAATTPNISIKTTLANHGTDFKSVPEKIREQARSYKRLTYYAASDAAIIRKGFGTDS